MESQPQNPEFRNKPENYLLSPMYPAMVLYCLQYRLSKFISRHECGQQKT